MIRINLLGEKVDRSATYAIHGLAVAVSCILALFGCILVHGSMSTRLELAMNQKSILEGQVNKLREKTKKVDALEKNKRLLSEKLTTIAKLKAKKSGPVHLMDDLTRAIPERSWLTGIKQKSDGMEFSGIALDPQTVSTFMTSLSASKWIQGVELEYSRQAMHDSVAIQEFALLVKIRNALDVNKAKDDKAAKGGAPAAPGAPAASSAPAVPAASPAEESKGV